MYIKIYIYIYISTIYVALAIVPSWGANLDGLGLAPGIRRLRCLAGRSGAGLQPRHFHGVACGARGKLGSLATDTPQEGTTSYPLQKRTIARAT